MPQPIDYTSATWLQVADWARTRLQALRTRNDGDLDPTDTAILRGQIKALKELLDLPAAAARATGAAPGMPAADMTGQGPF